MTDRPARLGPWAVGRVLGTGETSSVHLCTRVDDPGRTAAVKILAGHDPETVARFREEAEILASLDHPSIVRVHGLDLEEQLPYLEMDHIDGRSVAERLLDGPIPVAEALDIARQVLDALVYLHGRNVAHRDVRPSNLLVHDGRVVLVDFGLARRSAATLQDPVRGGRVGAAVYAPPEWIGSSGVRGQAWDLYAFGVLLYEVLTGCAPFPVPVGTPDHVAAAKVMAAKREVDCLDPGEGFPDALRALVRELTARDPAERPRSATAVVPRLASIPDPTVQPPPRSEPKPDLSPRYHLISRAWTALTGLVVLGALGLLAAVAARLAGAL